MTVLLQNVTVVTKCGAYYKLRQYAIQGNLILRQELRNVKNSYLYLVIVEFISQIISPELTKMWNVKVKYQLVVVSFNIFKLHAISKRNIGRQSLKFYSEGIFVAFTGQPQIKRSLSHLLLKILILENVYSVILCIFNHSTY